MSRYGILSFIASALLLFAGAANAEQRYFEFTGTVTRSDDARFAPVGSVVRGSFNYDDAAVGDYLPDRAFYDVDVSLVVDINGHTIVSEGSTVTLYNYDINGRDIVWVYSTPGIAIDRKFYPEAYVGFSLFGSGLDGFALPSGFDLDRYTLAEGGLILDSAVGGLVDFSIDSITNVSGPPELCLKKNGKFDRHCKDKGL